MKLYELHNDKISEWVVYILGPADTLYANGIFKALIRFPETFPMDPPSVQFLSNFFHPNVYRDGKVCITTLQHPIPDHLRDPNEVDTNSETGFWSPANGIETILMSIVSLLSDPNPDDPANAEAGDMYSNNKSMFVKRVQETIEQSIKDKPSDLEIHDDDFDAQIPNETTNAIIDDLHSQSGSDADFDFDSDSDGEVGQEDSDDDQDS